MGRAQPVLYLQAQATNTAAMTIHCKADCGGEFFCSKLASIDRSGRVWRQPTRMSSVMYQTWIR